MRILSLLLCLPVQLLSMQPGQSHPAPKVQVQEFTYSTKIHSPTEVSSIIEGKDFILTRTLERKENSVFITHEGSLELSPGYDETLSEVKACAMFYKLLKKYSVADPVWDEWFPPKAPIKP